MSEPSVEFQQLNARLQKLEESVAELNKKHIGLVDYILKNGSPTTSNTTSASNSKESSASNEKNETPLSLKTPVGGPRATETASLPKDPLSAKLLPVVSVICFVMAAVFIVKLAIDSGWLNLERQWGLLNLLGISLIATGLFGTFIADKNYRSHLASAGLLVLYIAALACKLYFGLFSTDFSILLVALISASGVYLAKHFQSEVFLVLTSIGAYLAPMLLGSEKDLMFYSFYFVIASISFSTISILMQSRVVSLISSYFGIGVYAFLNNTERDSNQLILILCVEVIQFVAFTFGAYLYSLTNRSVLSKKMSMLFMPLLLFFYGTTYYFLNALNPTLAPWISLSFAGFLFLLYWKAKAELQNIESQQLVFGFMSVVLVHSGYMQLLPSQAKPWLIPLILLLMYIADKKQDLPVIAPILRATFLILGAIEYFGLCFEFLKSGSDWSHLLPALASIAMGCFYYMQGPARVKNRESLFLAMIHALAILMLYRVAFAHGTFMVTLAWSLYAFVILGFGYYRREKFVAKSSLLVLILAGLKALVYDASQAPSYLRILSLLLTGVLLYGAGYLLKKINHWGVDSSTGA